MKMNEHVSPALASLQRGVTAAAAVVAVCLIVQAVIFGFVHFTDVRWEAPKKDAPAPNTVVEGGTDPLSALANGEIGATGKSSVDAIRRAASKATGEPDRVRGRWDGVMRQFGNGASWVGMLAAMFLGLQLMLGAIIAGGAAVPGVDRVVRSASWGLILLLVCVPFQEAFATLPVRGIMSPYSVLCAASEAAVAGFVSDAGLIANHAVLPFIGLSVAMFVVWQFRSGVACGVMTDGMNAFDARIEREMGAVQARGPGSNFGPRIAGSFATVGEPPISPLRATGTDPEMDEVRRTLARNRPKGNDSSGMRPI
jgi:hypothetical protein